MLRTLNALWYVCVCSCMCKMIYIPHAYVCGRLHHVFVCVCVQLSRWVSACKGMCFCESISIRKHLFAFLGLVLNVHQLNLTFQHCPKLHTGKRSWKLWQRSILSFPLLCYPGFPAWLYSLWPKTELIDLMHSETSLLKTLTYNQEYNKLTDN